MWGSAMFTDDEILQLKRYLQTIIDKPRRMDEQPHRREGVFLFCEDWEIIEILKYLFNGAPTYDADPPPNRLKHNPLWSKAAIAAQAEQLLATYGSAELIIDALRRRRDGAALRIS